MRGLWMLLIGMGAVYVLHAQPPALVPQDTLAYTTGLLEAQRALLLGRLEEAHTRLTRLTSPTAPASVYWLWARLHAQNEALEKGRTAIEEAIARDVSERHYYEWAIALEEEARAPTRVAALTEALLTHCPPTPARPTRLRQLFGLYMDLRQPHNALRVLDSIAHYGTEPPTWMGIQRAQLLLAIGQTQAARTRLESLRNEYPDEADTHIALALFLAQRGRQDEAIALLRQAQSQFPLSASLQEALMDLYIQIQHKPEALRVLKVLFEADELAVEDKIAWLSRVQNELSLSKSERQRARQWLLDAHADRPEAWIATADLLLRIDEPLLAQQDYLTAIKRGFHSLLVWQNVISIDIEERRYGAAVQRAREALMRYEKEPMLYWMMGMAHYFQKEYPAALEALGRCVQYAEWVDVVLASNAYAQTGDIYYELDDTANAMTAYDEAIQLNPDNDHALNNYSYLLADNNTRLTEALRMSMHLMRLRPDEVSYLDTHAWVLYRLKRYKEALRFLKKALALAPYASGTIVEHYGDVLYALGRKKQALQQWKLAQTRGETSAALQSKINTHARP